MTNLFAGIMTGAVVGGVYLALLWIAVRSLPTRGGAVVFVLLAFSRAALVIGALWVFILQGLPAITILGAVAGFVIIRVIATHAANFQSGQATWK